MKRVVWGWFFFSLSIFFFFFPQTSRCKRPMTSWLQRVIHPAFWPYRSPLDTLKEGASIALGCFVSYECAAAAEYYAVASKHYELCVLNDNIVMVFYICSTSALVGYFRLRSVFKDARLAHRRIAQIYGALSGSISAIAATIVCVHTTELYPNNAWVTRGLILHSAFPATFAISWMMLNSYVISASRVFSCLDVIDKKN